MCLTRVRVHNSFVRFELLNELNNNGDDNVDIAPRETRGEALPPTSTSRGLSTAGSLFCFVLFLSVQMVGFEVGLDLHFPLVAVG